MEAANRFSVTVKIHQFAAAVNTGSISVTRYRSADPPCKYFCFHLVRRFSKGLAGESAYIDQAENNVARAISTGRVMIYQSAIYGAVISPISNELFLPSTVGDWEIWLRSANESEIYNWISRANR